MAAFLIGEDTADDGHLHVVVDNIATIIIRRTGGKTARTSKSAGMAAPTNPPSRPWTFPHRACQSAHTLPPEDKVVIDASTTNALDKNPRNRCSGVSNESRSPQYFCHPPAF